MMSNTSNEEYQKRVIVTVGACPQVLGLLDLQPPPLPLQLVSPTSVLAIVAFVAFVAIPLAMSAWSPEAVSVQIYESFVSSKCAYPIAPAQYLSCSAATNVLCICVVLDSCTSVRYGIPHCTNVDTRRIDA